MMEGRKMVEKRVYIASTEEKTGKSVIAIGLALIARDLGKKVGYFKSIGVETSEFKDGAVDEDVKTMMKLLDLKGDPKLYSPIILGRETFLDDFDTNKSSKYIGEILSAYEKASREKEVMLIEGATTLSSGAFLSCSVPSISSRLNADIILVSRFKKDHTVDDVLQAYDYASKYGANMLGVIINRVPSNMKERVENVIKPLLEKNGVRVLGMMPEDKLLSSIPVREIYEAIGGNLLAGEEGMDKMVETILVGAMSPESAMRYFQKAKNELVITGGDRTDIVFAALEAGARAIILTGNLYPSVKIFPRADELAIPLILVPYDTYTTLQILQGIVGKIRPEDQKRIDRAKEIVAESVDWKHILSE